MRGFKPMIMGILNVTPDSFSDGGLFFDASRAIEQGRKLEEEGADIIDVGGVSTRPGSDCDVDEKEEMLRVLPVIEALSSQCRALISVDTTRPEVAKKAVALGASMINDVSMLRNGLGLAEVAACTGVEIVLMHSRKTPKDMQRDIAYGDVVEDVARELAGAAERAICAGVKKERIWLDPGIGFAKTASHNIELLSRLPEIVSLGFPVVVGPSRKSFIGEFTGAGVKDRIGGTAAAVTAAVLGGAHAVRVHDVAVMRQAAVIAGEMSGNFRPLTRGGSGV